MIRPLRTERFWTAVFAVVLVDCVAPSMPPDRVAPAAARAPSAVPERSADKPPQTPQAAPSPLDDGTARVASRAAALFGKWTVTGDKCPGVCAMDDAES